MRDSLRKHETSSVRDAQIVQAIRVQSVIGAGTNDDPVRTVVDWFETDGKHLVTYDSWAQSAPKEPAR